MPCKRASHAAARAFGIERVGGFPRARIDGGDGVQRRALLVVRLDAREIRLNQLPRRHFARRHGALQLIDRLLHDVE